MAFLNNLVQKYKDKLNPQNIVNTIRTVNNPVSFVADKSGLTNTLSKAATGFVNKSGVRDVAEGAVQNIVNTPKGLYNIAKGNTQKGYEQLALAQKGSDRVFGSTIENGKYKFTGSGVPRVAATTYGMVNPGARAASLIGGGFNAAFAKMSGEDPANALGEGMAGGLQANAVSTLTNPYLKKLIPKGTGILADRLAPAVANVAQGVATDITSGNKTTLASLGMDAATGLVSGKNQFDTPNAKGFDFGRNSRSKWHPEDVSLLDQLNEYMQSKNVSNEVLDGIDRDVTDLARGYLPVSKIQKLANDYGSNTKGLLKATIKELQKSARDAESEGFKGIVLGAVGDRPAVRQSIIRDFGRDPQLTTKKMPEIIDEDTAKGNILNSLMAEDPFLGQDKNLLQKVKEQINGVFIPVKNTSPEFQQTFTKWVNSKMVARTNANALAQKYKTISPEIAPEVIDYMQGVTKKASPEVKNIAGQLRKEFDSLYEQANEAGLDVKYLKDYLTNIWQESLRDIEVKMQSLGQNFKFASERTIPNYKTGIELGLTPKFSNPAQIVAEYARKLETTRANIELFKDLKAQGVIITAKEVAGDSGFKPILAPGFPQSVATDGESTIRGYYYAPKKIADFINTQFSEQEKTPILGALADLSRTMQDVSLSGGLPFTPINAFSIAQAQKEFLAGRPLASIKAAFHSLTKGMADDYFNSKTATMAEMQTQGIPMNSTLDYEKLFDNQYINKSLREKFGDKASEIWGKAFNDPTFERFMPMLQIQLYEDVKNGLLKRGYATEEAVRIAGENVKNFYGVVNGQATGRSQAISDGMTALFFAPKYRESMIGLWANTLKLLDPRQTLKPENRTNLKFALGALITYGTMNALNKSINGHGMSENPEGKKDKLLIPLGDGTTLGVPYLSSIATVPRAIAGIAANLVSGNTSEAGKNVFKLASKPVQTFGNIVSNQDYFGNEIYNETDSGLNKFSKQAQYVAGQTMQPYVRELSNIVMAKMRGGETKPGYQIASQALELPLRFYKTDSVNNGKFFDKYGEVKKIGERYEEMKYKKPDEALKFLQQHKDEIDQYNLMKAQIKQGYATKEATGKFELPGKGAIPQAQAMSESNQTLTKDQRDFVRERMRLGDTTVTDNEKIQAFLGKYLDTKPKNKYDLAGVKSDLLGTISDIENSVYLSDQDKELLLTEVGKASGYTRDDISYYQVARLDNNTKTSLVLDQVSSLNGKELTTFLENGRKNVNGDVLISDGVIDNLVTEEIITKAEGRRLKKIDLNEDGTAKKKSSGGSKKVKFPTVEAPKIVMPKLGGSRPRQLVKVGRRTSTPKLTVRSIKGKVKRVKTLTANL